METTRSETKTSSSDDWVEGLFKTKPTPSTSSSPPLDLCVGIMGRGDASVRMRTCNGEELLKFVEAQNVCKWEDNRDVDQQRVSRIVSVQTKKMLDTGSYAFFSNPFVFCRLKASAAGEKRRRADASDVKTYLIDGQHRMESLRKLPNRSRAECFVMTIECASRAQVEDCFLMVNSGTSVPASYYHRKTFAILTEFLNWLASLYPGHASDSERPQRPNYNPNKIKDGMSTISSFRDAVMDQVIIDDSLLRRATQELNDEEKNRYQRAPHSMKQKIATPTIYARVKKSGFYLGMKKTDEWLLGIVNRALELAEQRNVTSTRRS